MKGWLSFLLALTLLAPSGLAQGPVAIIDNATPIIGGSTGQCVTRAANGTVTLAACSAAPFAPVATTITATGTTSYAIPAGASVIEVTLWGAGGGGGSGRCGLIATSRAGGVGGFGSMAVYNKFLVSDLTSPVTVTIGTGGTGGTAISASDTSGNPGTAGGDSTFGSYMRSLGALGGPGGVAAATAATVAGTQQSPYWVPSGAALTTLQGTPANIYSPLGGGAGGTGGSITTTNTISVGIQAQWTAFADPLSTAPVGPSGDGVSGTPGFSSALGWVAGYGGGSGGASITVNGGDGAVGGRASGGGGGGACLNGKVSGGGGNGGNGKAYIIAR